MSNLLDSLLTPQQRRQAEAWDFFQQARDAYHARKEGTAGDPLDPPTTVDLTSMQKLGDADVLVCYEESADGITVTGVDLRNGFAEAEWFAADTVAYWRECIGAELKRDRS